MRLLNKDARFSQSMEYIFAFQYATELKQLRSDMSMALKRQCSDGKRITVGDMRNFSEGEPDDMERHSIQVHEKCTRNSCILASSTL